jgi:hypothetical protein
VQVSLPPAPPPEDVIVVIPEPEILESYHYLEFHHYLQFLQHQLLLYKFLQVNDKELSALPPPPELSELYEFLYPPAPAPPPIYCCTSSSSNN